ncbi:hypothetical protein QFZ39_002553 [Paraburkholderia graminis]|uniref:hypothetical protein n=1 Tax=Paraburkholderia sp. RCC_158 TaxID=3239220 RepID=UPI000419B1C1|nr:hypothetical protein [Paraburkholderia graminis]
MRQKNLLEFVAWILRGGNRDDDGPNSAVRLRLSHQLVDEAYGTSTKEELLCRVMFRALPNHYSVVA